MLKWMQKELFFFAMLAFVFVTAASVSRFLKTHLHQETLLTSTARVIWPDNQAAVYPEKPPASFFLAQKEKPAKKATAPAPNADMPTVRSSIQDVITGTTAQNRLTAIARVYPPTKAPRQRQISRKVPKTRAYRVSQAPKPIIKRIKQTGASTPTSKTTHSPTPDTLALRAYDVHMKWVKKTLAEYQDASP